MISESYTTRKYDTMKEGNNVVSNDYGYILFCPQSYHGYQRLSKGEALSNTISSNRKNIFGMTCP